MISYGCARQIFFSLKNSSHTVYTKTYLPPTTPEILLFTQLHVLFLSPLYLNRWTKLLKAKISKQNVHQKTCSPIWSASGHGAWPIVGWWPSDTPLEESSFFQQPSTVTSFLAGVELRSLSLLWAGICLVWICAGLMCDLTVSMSSCVHQSCCVWMMFFPWDHLWPLGLQSQLFQFPFILHRFLSLGGGGGGDKDILFKAECSKVSYSLHIIHSWVSVDYHLLQ